MGSAFSFGFIFGPVIGGLLGAIDLRLPFMAAAALTLINWLYGFFILPESLPPEQRATTLRLEEGQPAGLADAAALAHRPACRWRAWASCSSWPTWSCRRSSSSTWATATTGRRRSWAGPSWPPASPA